MMKSKLKNIFIPFILMFIFYLAAERLDIFWEFGMFVPHVGILYLSGLLFGIYGAIGAVAANVILNGMIGYSPIEILPSALISFGISYLAYKQWYLDLENDKPTLPILDNTYHLGLFLLSIFICGSMYSIMHGNLFYVFYGIRERVLPVEYMLNFTNVAFVFGILAIWLSNKIDFIETPKKTERKPNKRLYRIIFYSLITVTIISLISYIYKFDTNIVIIETILFTILLFAYLTKPITYEIKRTTEKSILENITNAFLITTLVIALFGILVSLFGYSDMIINIDAIDDYLPSMPLLVITDMLIVFFFIPGFAILRYIEKKVIKPISSFSEIEKFIKENEKIEAEGLLNIYSSYIGEQNEIGTLARSYTELIKHNNNYIENIREIEGEKERINAELDIATRIQAASLPTESIENDDFVVDGYSHPAKEVGGDFFDYYKLDDDNFAIVIGDASGKGIPAALMAMITQVLIKQILEHVQDPSEVLNTLNDHLCQNNPESMFITLWLGIYNRKTKKLIFSNAGHNPPLIKENGQYRYLTIDTGIVLGIMEDFNYINEDITLTDEIVLYTDGITDANNENDEMYGETRLLNSLNRFKGDKNPIIPLLDDIHDFTGNQEQYDDMTLLYLKIK